MTGPSNDPAGFHSVTFKERHVHCKPCGLENEQFVDEEQRRLSRLMTTEGAA